MATEERRRRAEDTRLTEVHERLGLHEEELVELRESIQELTTQLREFGEVLDVYKGLKATLKFVSAVERMAVFVAKMGGAAAIMWASWKFVFSETIERLGKGQ